MVRSSEYPCLKKLVTADTFWATMATRLVPLATFPGRPRKMSTGSASSEPPPAMTFRKPERTPTPASRNSCQSSNSMGA